MTQPGSGLSPSDLVDRTARSLSEGVKAGLLWAHLDAGTYRGRHLEIDEARLLNFGGCSYLGLEQHPDVRQGAIDAIHTYGTQFSFSRTYLESPLYRVVESRLQQITGGGHVLVTASTSLAHIAALPVLISAGDAVLIDRSTHASVHTATALLRGVDVKVVAHDALDEVDREIGRLARRHRRVWYLIDGLYSMFGDLAPMDRVAELLAKYPELHVYVDDAHSTSWTGTHGRGVALEKLPDRSRVVVALSLNKAFSAAGGALVFPDAETRDRVRLCGGPMIFSGPVQPPMLGAAAASAALHLAPEFAALQAEELERLKLVVSLCQDSGVSLVSEDLTPIFFVVCGRPETTFAVTNALRERGFYVCISLFPAVAERQSGIRFTISLHNTPDDIRALVHALSAELKRTGASSTRIRAVAG